MVKSQSKVVSVNHLDLRKKEVSTRGVPILAYEAGFISHRIQAIAHLDLGCSGVGAPALDIIAHTLHRISPRQLHTLLLDGNALTHEALEGLLLRYRS